MNKYGIENFTIEELECCPNEELDEKEVYWIDFYHTYGEGYNCTAGGEGGILYFEKDLEEIINRYKKGERLDLLCKEFHHDYTTVKQRMTEKGILINTKAGPQKLAKKIQRINPNNLNDVAYFNSISDAARAICPEGHNYRAIANHISKNKNTNTISHGFLWKTC